LLTQTVVVRKISHSGNARRLLHLLPRLATTPGLVHAIFPTRRGMVPAMRHLLDALAAGFEALNRQR